MSYTWRASWKCVHNFFYSFFVQILSILPGSYFNFSKFFTILSKKYLKIATLNFSLFRPQIFIALVSNMDYGAFWNFQSLTLMKFKFGNKLNHFWISTIEITQNFEKLTCLVLSLDPSMKNYCRKKKWK